MRTAGDRHLTTAEMVNNALKTIKKGRKGVSFQAIRKYIATTYLVDDGKLAPHIKKYLRTAVEAGIFLQVKGKGAAGSFKLNKNSGRKKSTKNTHKNTKQFKAKKSRSKTSKMSRDSKQEDRHSHFDRRRHHDVDV